MSSLGLIGEYGSESSSEDEWTQTEKSIDTSSSTITAPTHTQLSSKDDSSDPTHQETTQSYFDADNVDSDGSSSSSIETGFLPSPAGSPLAQPGAKGLPLPQLDAIHCGVVKAQPGSVFSNPYKEAEESKLLVLKQHVTLGPAEVASDRTKGGQFRGKKRSRQRDQEESGPFDKYDSSIKREKMNRVKSGVAPGLVPSQKYLKLHHRQQEKERPWTIRRTSN